MSEQLENLTVRETAEFLRVSEKTIYRWIRQGVIPTFKFQGQYRFDRKEIEAWARYRRIGGSTASPAAAEGNEEKADLGEAVRHGGIHYKLEGSGADKIFRNVVDFFPFGAGVPPELKDALVQDLVEREALVSTGIGNGIALPHPRHPRDWGLGAPLVGVFFLDGPVEFHAFDGDPVFVLFVILCSSIKGHLGMLSQVSHLLNAPDMRAYLRGQPARTDLMQRIEHGLSGARAGKRR